MKLKNLKERAAIDKIWERYGEKIEYDDCAVVDNGKDFLLYTTDFVGEGTHFLPDSNPLLVGKFFVDVNLSDIAAMGGFADYFMASMFFSADVDFEYVENLVEGMKKELKKYGVKYLGGDFKESKITGFSGFAIGHVEREKIMRRKGAKIGDRIFVSGELGEKGALYYLWKKGLVEFDSLLNIQPRLEFGRKIAGQATTCMDSSDGLFSVLSELQSSNNLGFNVSLSSLPLHKRVVEVIEDYSVNMETLLGFGGEYELIYTSMHDLEGYEIGEVVKEKNNYGGHGYESFGKALD